MSLRKKDVYSTLSDYSRKVLGKSCSLERAILNDKSCLEQAKSSSNAGCGLSVKDCYTTLRGKSQLKETLSCKKNIRPTPTPPNSPNYKNINTEISIKTREEP